MEKALAVRAQVPARGGQGEQELVSVSHPTKFSQSTNSDSGISRELIKAMAMDIGKSLVAYIEVMYPDAIKATSSTFKLSMRNHVYNDIMSIVELHDEAAIRTRLAKNEAWRKEWVGAYRKLRRKK